jgi:mannose-6-phosphate isomerase-like protein (cupin superfamily)
LTTTQKLNRRWLLAATSASFVPGAADATAAPKRFVTREIEPGRGGLVFRNARPNTVELNGSKITRLWETPGVPVELGTVRDAGASAGNAYRDGFAGTSLYVAEIPPRGAPGARVPMHRQDSLDYIAVLSGSIHLLLDGEEVELGPGDVLVQAGNTHGWENRRDEPCRMLVVVLRADHAAEPTSSPAGS